jgi:release factor glutamine methyltransferase
VAEETWTIVRLINWTTDFLRSQQIRTPRLDTELLLSYLLGLTRIELYLNFDRPLKKKELGEFKCLIKREVKREPIAYIIGHKEFWSLDFMVTKDVLIPRPETEVLVEETLKIFQEGILSANNCRILEVGTGSGAVAISLAKELPGISIIATDNSIKALRVAAQNVERHRVTKMVKLLGGDLLGPFRNCDGFTDIIISNPPYIPERDFKNLPSEIRDFEPKAALDGGKDGLYFYRKIIYGAARYLRDNGHLLLEIGENQTERVVWLIKETGRFKQCYTVKDLGGKDRVVKTQKR